MRRTRQVPFKHIDPEEDEYDEEESEEYDEEDRVNHIIKVWEEESGLKHPKKQLNARKDSKTTF